MTEYVRMIHDFADFAKHYDAGTVCVDFGSSDLAGKAKERYGWKIGFFTAKRDFLRRCRECPENFETAYRTLGADFWITR